MIQVILAALDRVGAAKYSISEVSARTAELFFIRKQLDTRRAKDTRKFIVTVYHDFDKNGVKMRGSSTAFVHPGMTAEQVERVIADAYRAAAFVANPFFELYKGGEGGHVNMPSALGGMSEDEIARRMTEGLFAPDVAQDAFINSAELFISRTDCRILTSEGVDVGFTANEVNGEFVVQCTTPNDVEQYRSFSYREPDAEALSEKAAEALRTVRDRSKATDGPAAGEYDVVLSGDHLYTLLGLYLARADAAMIYPKYSSYAPGCMVQGDGVTGERLNMRLLPEYPFSGEGIPMTERTLIRDGRLELIHGSTRFCRYLGVEPIGSYERIAVDNGAADFDQMCRGSLYVVSFSDFQTDEFSGHFGGEIRLGYLYDNEGRCKLVTGGSINGSLFDCGARLTFSKERYSSSQYDGPFAVRLTGVKVAGK